MQGMSSWDMVLLGVAGFIAITSLVRLMARQRRIVLAKLQTEVAEEQARQEAEKKEKAKLEKQKTDKRGNASKARV